MKCIFCTKDSLKEVLTVYEKNINGERILVENVPALFCETCGDYYFDSDVVKQIKKLLKKDIDKTITIKIFDYREIH